MQSLFDSFAERFVLKNWFLLTAPGIVLPR